MAEPKWLEIARKYEGIKEVPGVGNNPKIVEWAQTCTMKATDDATPWCSEFVNGVLTEAGFKGTNSAAAKSWLDWGDELDGGVPGAITILTRTGGNHVGFWLAEDNMRVKLLGGNQGDMVKEAWFDKRSILGYRWPEGYPLESEEPDSSPTISTPLIMQPGPSGEAELLGNSEQFEPFEKIEQFKPDELALARQYLPIIQAAADAYTWPPELIAVMQQALGPNWMVWVLCGIASRESRFGLLLDAEGLGDGGHGHSIMQIDDRSHPAFCAGDDWKDLAASLEYVHKNVIVSSFNYLGDCCFEVLQGDYAALFRASIAGYNCGPGNVRKALEAGEDVDARTTGRDYSADVLKRARGFKEVLE
jgi:uncharacterized protein (TIGR02594 family)